MPTMTLLSRAEIEKLRAQLLTRSQLSYDELLIRAAEYSLSLEQSTIAEQIADLDYLLEVA